MKPILINGSQDNNTSINNMQVQFFFDEKLHKFRFKNHSRDKRSD